MSEIPLQDMGRGIMAPPDNRNIETGAKEMRTLAATTKNAIDETEALAAQQLASQIAVLKASPGLLLSRGTLPDETDLNTLVGLEHVGVWSLDSTFTYGNLPVPVLSSRSTLEVAASGHASSVSHRVITGNALNVANRGTWDREIRQAGEFYPWERQLTTRGVTSVVASSNYEEPGLAEGDLLVVTPSRRYWTDFRFNAPNSSPAGWTARWNTGATRRVVAEPTVPGGRVLSVSTPDNLRRALKFDEVPDSLVAEIVIKARASTSAAFPRPTIVGSGAAGTEAGFFAFISSVGYPSVARIKDGTTGATTSPTQFNFIPDTWTYARVRYFNRTVSAKFWNEGTPEPKDWMITLSHAASVDVPAGWAGLQFTDTANTQIAWVGVALDGGRAPMGAW